MRIISFITCLLTLTGCGGDPSPVQPSQHQLPISPAAMQQDIDTINSIVQASHSPDKHHLEQALFDVIALVAGQQTSVFAMCLAENLPDIQQLQHTELIASTATHWYQVAAELSQLDPRKDGEAILHTLQARSAEAAPVITHLFTRITGTDGQAGLLQYWLQCSSQHMNRLQAQLQH